jgi:two-component system NtrC family sensor kinase
MIETSHDSEWVQLTVSDTGSGICSNHQLEIFHPFFTTKPAGQGTGLGLSVSLGIAQAHGGFIEMTSMEGEGSSFMLRLPKIHAERREQ